jgi:hypothetical protein
MRRLFRHKLNLDTEYLIQQRIDFLSGTDHVYYDMCRNSCRLYAGDHTELTQCDYCNADRFHPNGKAVARFAYIPLVPRLCGWFQCQKMVEQMDYRHSYVHIPGETSDIFDGQHYLSLQTQRVIIDGVTLDHNFFSDPRDIALGGSTDGFQVCSIFFQVSQLTNNP